MSSHSSRLTEHPDLKKKVDDDNRDIDLFFFLTL